jgi:hypothetical protein
MSERSLAAVFSKSKVTDAHAHRFRHTFAAEILARGGTMSDVADVLSISENVARKHYAKWSPARQERISGIMRRVFTGTSEETQRVAAVQQTRPEDYLDRYGDSLSLIRTHLCGKRPRFRPPVPKRAGLLVSSAESRSSMCHYLAERGF